MTEIKIICVIMVVQSKFEKIHQFNLFAYSPVYRKFNYKTDKRQELNARDCSWYKISLYHQIMAAYQKAGKAHLGDGNEVPLSVERVNEGSPNKKRKHT